MVCWIANDTRLFLSNCFPTDRVILNWSRCSHIHWPIYLLHWNMDQAKDGQVFTFYMTTPPLIIVRLLSLFRLLKVKVLNHPPYSPDLSPCDFSLFPRLKKMLSGNKYMSRSSLQWQRYLLVSPTDTKRRLFICFSRLGKKVTKMCFSKGGILWRFVIKICLIKRSTEVIRTQWQNFLQDPRTLSRNVRKRFFLTYSPNEDSNQAGHPFSLISLLCSYVEALHSWFPKCAQWRFWSDCANAQADLNLGWGWGCEVAGGGGGGGGRKIVQILPARL